MMFKKATLLALLQLVSAFPGSIVPDTYVAPSSSSLSKSVPSSSSSTSLPWTGRLSGTGQLLPTDSHPKPQQPYPTGRSTGKPRNVAKSKSISQSTSYIPGTVTSVVTETKITTKTKFVPCSTPVTTRSGTTFYTTYLTTSKYIATDTTTYTAYPSPRISAPLAPAYPVPSHPGDMSCPYRPTVTVTHFVLHGPSYSTPASVPQTTETFTVTLGNGHTTTICTTYPAPTNTHRGGRPPYPFPSEHPAEPSHKPSGSGHVKPRPPHPTGSSSTSHKSMPTGYAHPPAY